MSRFDPELDELFEASEDRRLAELLASVRAPEAVPDAAFRSQLRRQLMDQAWKLAEPKLPWWRRAIGPAGFAWAGAAVGVLLIAVVVYSLSNPGSDNTTFVTYNVGLSHPVAAVQPVEMTFSQPMDRGSVERAVKIEPATEVSFQWTSDTQVDIRPVAQSFAPNTQYTVNLQPGVAETAQGKPLPPSKPAVFTVEGPSPSPVPVTPTPTSTPTATPPPPPAFSPVEIGAASAVKPQYAADGTLVFVGADGLLRIVAPGTSPVSVPAAGVHSFAIAPDSTSVALVTTTGAFQAALKPPYTVAPLPAAGALAATFDGTGKLWVATATGVGQVGPGARPLGTGAVAAWFSPGATYLVYQPATGPWRTVDLASGKETTWPAAPANPVFLGWSPDAKHVLYATGDALFSSDPFGAGASSLAAQPGVTSADWSAKGSILFATAGALFQVRTDGSPAAKLVDGAFGNVAWTPAGGVAFVRAGSLYTAELPAPPSSQKTPVTLDEANTTVTAYLQARHDGRTTDAAGLVDTAQASAARVTAPAFSRWFTVFAQAHAGQVVELVRIVVADKSGLDTAQADETVTVGRDANGKIAIEQVTDSATRPYGKAPEVISVQVSAGEIKVGFDSDLSRDSVAPGVVLRDAAGKVLPTQLSGTGREVDLALPIGAATSGTDRLAVLPALKDRDGRSPGAEWDLDLVLSAPA
ncbi:MAG TPA: Ig-like domain-containing protein [Candidatus Dormibacteraeota bacterium]